MKILKFIFVFLLFLILLSPSASKATPAEVEISSCKSNDNARPITGEYETFTSTYDHVSKISVYASVWPGETLTIALLDNSGNYLLQNSIPADGAKWYTASWGEGFNITPGSIYRVFTSVTGAGSNWFISNNTACNSTGAAYSSGSAISPAIDFNYIVYGYNNEPIDINPGTENNNSTNTTPSSSSATSSSQTSTNAPASTTSSAIVKPSKLAAQYLADSKSVKLTWTKSSTTTIDGYRIFRSESETTGFLKVGEVKKDILEYSDTGIVEGKKYYYFVRAYKGTAESASSETVNVTVAPQAAVASTTPTASSTPASAVSNTNKINWLLIGLSATVILLVGFLLFYRFYWLRKKNSVINK